MDCAWVNKESANTRCGFKHVAETSTLTCGTCEDCIDSTSRLNFFSTMERQSQGRIFFVCIK
jgi:hypothetical protein